MKKIFAILLMLCMWLPLCAFQDVSSGAVINTNGTVNEVVTIRYSQDDAESVGVTFTQLHNAVTQMANSTSLTSIKSILQTKYQNKVLEDDELSNEEKQTLLQQVSIATASKITENDGQFVLNITYTNKSAWNWFCNDSIAKAQETTEVSLFVKNYITTMPIKLSTVTADEQEISLFDYIYNMFTTKLSQQLGKNISTILSREYSYVYATNVARLHSDAQQVEYSSSTGLTYYLWNFTIGETNPQITLWQTRANVITWYCLALCLTAVLGIILFLSSKQKKVKHDEQTY